MPIRGRLGGIIGSDLLALLLSSIVTFERQSDNEVMYPPPVTLK
jgi:hypothetical protein